MNTLIAQDCFAFPAPRSCAIIRGRRGNSGMGPGHNATTVTRSSVVGGVVGFYPAKSISYALPQRHNGAFAPPYMCARARMCTHVSLSLSLLWRCRDFYSLDLKQKKATTLPTTPRVSTVVALWIGVVAGAKGGPDRAKLLKSLEKGGF